VVFLKHQLMPCQTNQKTLNFVSGSKALQLTNTQKKEIQKIIGDHATQIRHLFQPGADRDEEKMIALRAVFHDKIMELLTDEQKTKWKDLQGEPFKVRSASDHSSDKP
jgi:hypothetical protein